MALQIPSIPPFKLYGDQNTVAIRWTEWKKSFPANIYLFNVNNRDTRNIRNNRNNSSI